MIPDNSNKLPVNTSTLTRFFSKIYICDDMWFNGTPCWIWTAARQKTKGYGYFSYLTKQWHGRAYKVAYRMFVGEVPEGLQLDHLCRVRQCVNPAHLEPVTSWENSLRGNNILALRLKQTHCKHGHEFTADNIYRLKGGGRQCRICRRESGARFYREHPGYYDKYWKKIK